MVSFGYDTKGGQAFLASIRKSRFRVIDCRTKLPRDPNASVGHGQDGRYAQTQKVVIGQEKFPDFMKEVVTAVTEDAETLLALGCRQGIHRADTTGRMCTDILNSIVTSDGHRMYNAKLFSLSLAYGKRGFDQMIADSKTWARHPWCLVDGPLMAKDRFAQQSCMDSPASALNFQDVHEWVEAIHIVPWTMASPVLRPQPQPQPQQPVAPPTSSQMAAAQQRAEQQQHAEQRRSRSPPPLEPWETLNVGDATVWASTLHEFGADRTARQELFLLAQHSTGGFQEANSIISKLLKKRADHEDIRNVSAFIHKCVCNSRAELGSWSFDASRGGRRSGK